MSESSEVKRLHEEVAELRLQAMVRNRSNWQTGIDLTVALDRWEALLPEGADRAELDTIRIRHRRSVEAQRAAFREDLVRFLDWYQDETHGDHMARDGDVEYPSEAQWVERYLARKG